MSVEALSTDVIDSAEKLRDALSHWKNITFSQKYLKLDDVVKTLDTPDRLVEPRQEYAARWTLSRPGSRKPATLWTVAVWRWNSDLETGNFVPAGATAPARLPESRIQSVPGPLCQFSYGVDTTHDRSLWEAQEAFEKSIKALPKFNPANKDRRNWQSGTDPNRSMYIFTSQIFVKRTAYTRPKEANVSYTLHEWIRQATKKGMEYFPNDEKPEMWEPDKEMKLRPLAQCTPPALKVGDLVWLSFSVEFFIGAKYWVTNFIPYEFVRVGTVALDLLGDIKDFDPDGGEGPRERLGAGMASISVMDERKQDATEDPPQPPSKAQPEPNVASGSATTDPNRNEFFLTPEDAWKYRHIELLPPTSPSEWESSDTEHPTGSTNDVSDAGDHDNTMNSDDQPMEVDDVGGPGSEVDSSSIPIEEVIKDTLAPLAGAPTPVTGTPAPVTGTPAPLKEIPTIPKPAPKPKAKKRAASTERPPVDVATGGGVHVGGRVLRDRRDKGKAVAR